VLEFRHLHGEPSMGLRTVHHGRMLALMSLGIHVICNLGRHREREAGIETAVRIVVVFHAAG